MKYMITVIVMLLLAAPACKKSKMENQLPPKTHVGAYIFGCKIDGKIYTASGKDGGLLHTQYVSYGLISSDSSIYMSVRNTGSSNFGFDLTINYLDSIGTYFMKTYPYEGVFNDDSNGSIPGSSILIQRLIVI